MAEIRNKYENFRDNSSHRILANYLKWCIGYIRRSLVVTTRKVIIIIIIIIISVMELGHFLTSPGITDPEVSSKFCHNSFCQLGNSVSLPWAIYCAANEREKAQSNTTTCLERCILIMKLYVSACNDHHQVSTTIKKSLYIRYIDSS